MGDQVEGASIPTKYFYVYNTIEVLTTADVVVNGLYQLTLKT